MLRVTSSQRGQLSERARGRFHSELLACLRATFPAAFTQRGPTASAQFVRVGLARSRELGFRSARDVGRFVALFYGLGLALFESPRYAWARDILADEALAPGYKLDRIQRRLATGEDA